jgi:hypothetical protein
MLITAVSLEIILAEMARHYRLLLLILTLLLLPSLLCAQTQWRRVSSFEFNWDSHPQTQVVLEIPQPWDDPGDFTRIRIRVQGRKEFVLTNAGGWAKPPRDRVFAPDLRKITNIAPSDYILALNVAERRTALFLIGYQYASSPGSLDVIEISAEGMPRVVLRRDELWLKAVTDLDGDGIAEIIAHPCYSERFGDGLLTYDPFNVYKLSTQAATPARMSLPLTRTYNLKHYYGWAGANCTDKFAVVLHPPTGGKPLVLPTKDAEHLMETARGHSGVR